MRKVFYLCALSGLILTLASCGNKKTEEKEKSVLEKIIEENPRYDVDMIRTKTDSTAMVQMATQFLDLLVQQKEAEALELLYEKTESNEVQPLSAARKAALLKTLKAFPVLSFKIDEFRLYSDFDNEVRYTYEFMQKPEGSNVPNTMKGALVPVRLNGTWYLTIPDTVIETEKNMMDNMKYNQTEEVQQ
jgi:hypothetical protein